MNVKLSGRKIGRLGFHLLGYLYIASLANLAGAAATPPSKSEKQQYEDDQKTINSISTRRDISDYDAEFEKHAAAIDKKWSGKNKSLHADLVLELCNQISSGRFGKARAHGLARKYALTVLGDPDSIPLDTELKLVGHIGSDPNLPDGPKGNAWGSSRAEEAKAKLHAWKRLQDAMDPNWDPNDRPMMNVPLPAGVHLPRGVAPEAIKDPKQRAEYEAAIKENEKTAKRFSEQYGLRNRQATYEMRLEKYLVNAYSKPPLNKTELEGFLNTYVSSQAVRGRILSAVDQKILENEKHATVESSTAPFRGHPRGPGVRTKQANPKNQEAPH